MKKQLLPYIIVCIELAVLSCTNNSDPLVARVGNYGITLSEFENSYRQGKAINLVKSSTYEDFQKHLDKMIHDRLKIINAYKLNMDKEKDIFEYGMIEMERSLNSIYIEQEVVNKLVDEEEIKDLYRKQNVQVKARHILLRVPAGADKPTEAGIRQKANELYKRIKKGESFEEIAKKYSEDKVTGVNGGYLGTVKWGGVGYDDAFYNEIFNLKLNEISKPVQSQKGFHIIKIDEEKTFFTKSYGEVAPELKREILSRKQDESRERYMQMIEELKWKYRVAIDSSNVDLLIKKVEQGLFNGRKTQIQQTDDEFSVISSEEQKLNIASYKGGALKINEIINRLRLLRKKSRPRMHIRDEAYMWLDNLINLKITLKDAEAKGMHKSERLLQNRQNFIERLILRRINTEMIRNKVSLVEEDFTSYYEQFKEKYKTDALYKVQEILIREQALAENLVRRAKAGENFSQLAGQYTERISVKSKNGVLGYITEKQFGEVGKQAAKMKVGEISDMLNMGRKYSIIKLLDRKEIRLKTYDEAKIEVRRDRRREEERAIEKKWLDDLRSKMNVHKYENNLQHAFADLLER